MFVYPDVHSQFLSLCGFVAQEYPEQIAEKPPAVLSNLVQVCIFFGINSHLPRCFSLFDNTHCVPVSRWYSMVVNPMMASTHDEVCKLWRRCLSSMSKLCEQVQRPHPPWNDG